MSSMAEYVGSVPIGDRAIDHFKYYCQLPNSVLFEKNTPEEISTMEQHTPIYTTAAPDLILLCDICGALVPEKGVEKHHRFHRKLTLYLGS